MFRDQFSGLKWTCIRVESSSSLHQPAAFTGDNKRTLATTYQYRTETGTTRGVLPGSTWF